jgi:spermidine synthase
MEPRTRTITGVAIPLVMLALSGAAGLIAEVIWSRALATLFGSVITATGLILGVFMGGLALGAILGGQLARRLRRPLLAFGITELSVGLLVLTTPFLLRAVAPLVSALDRQLPDFLAPAVPSFFAILILGPIVTLMGATFPLFLAHLAGTPLTFASDSGKVYGINTFGAVIGTLLAGFWLIPLLGIGGSLRLAAGIDITVGIVCIGLGLRSIVSGTDSVSRVQLPWDPALKLAFWLAVLGGAAALTLEVAWFRLLTLILGSSVYAISMMLAAFLLGLSGGALLIARRADATTNVRGLLSRLHYLIAFFATLVTFLLQIIPVAYVALLQRTGASFAAVQTGSFLLIFLVLLVPTLMMGAALPIAIRLGAEGKSRAESIASAGRVYAGSSIGSAAGALAAGFVFLPVAGARGTVAMAVLLSMSAGFLAIRRSLTAGDRKVALQITVLTALIWGAWLGGVIPWNWRVLTGGYYAYAYTFSGDYQAPIGPVSRTLDVTDHSIERPFSDSLPEGPFAEEVVDLPEELLFLEDGLYAQVAVVQQGTVRSLLLNGKADASNTREDMRTQVLLGQLPVLLSPTEPHGDALIIGFGSGVTAGAIATWGYNRIVAAEIEPAVIRGSRYFTRENLGVLNDARLELRIDDGRRVVDRSQRRFAVITSEPSNLWMSGVSLLFTREFFELVSARLLDGGVFCQWLHLYQVGQDDVRTLLRTVAEVFPHMLVFAEGTDLLIVSSQLPLATDPRVWQERLMSNRTAADMLGRAEIDSAADLARRVIADQHAVRAWSAGAVMHTDDYPILEFSAARRLGSEHSGRILSSLVAAANEQGDLVLGPSARLVSGYR